MSIGLCSASDVITFDQNWHHLYSSSARGKDLSNDTQIAVSGQLSLKYTLKCLEIGVKNQEQISLNYTWLLRGKNFLSR